MKITLTVSSIPYWEYLKKETRKDIADAVYTAVGIDVVIVVGSLELEEELDLTDDVKVAGQLLEPLAHLLVDRYNRLVETKDHNLLPKSGEISQFIKLCRVHTNAIVSIK